MPEPRRSLLPIFNAAPPVSPFHQRLEEIRASLLPLDAAMAVRRFGPAGSARLLKTTISLCPDCLAPVPALVYVREGRVLMRKRCEEHGDSDALLESDERFYHLSNKDRWGRRYAAEGVIDFPAFEAADELLRDGGVRSRPAAEDRTRGFSDQMGNKTCTVLVEVTNACNLACPVCYSDAKGDRKLPLDAFRRYLRRADRRRRAGSTRCSSPAARPCCIPNSGRWSRSSTPSPASRRSTCRPTASSSREPEVAERLVPFRDKIMVLLQFDGRRTETNRALRDAEPRAGPRCR